jgi:hypothetical protein
MRVTRWKGLWGATALVAMLAALASPASGQEDARWLPWVGCWEEVDSFAPAELLCVRPVDGGVEMLTVAEGEVLATEALTGDGARHVIEEEGCNGSRSALFSADQRRLFVTAGLTCQGEFRRESTGLMALTSPTTWIDVQSVDVGERTMAWVRHFRLAPQELVEEAGLAGLTSGRGMALSTARYDAATAVGPDDVIEATEHVDGEAVRAWVAEMREPFDLNAERLVELADAGVAPEIIDVMVAVSYPEHFVVARDGAEAERAADEYDPRDRWGYSPRYGYWGSRFFFDPFYASYTRYGYGGYYGGLYGGYYGGYYGPTVVVVQPSGDDESARRGRLVRSRGYTRGSSSGTRGSSQPATRGTSSRPAGSVGSGTRSGGSSGGSSTGRKAKPRGGGGGGLF